MSLFGLLLLICRLVCALANLQTGLGFLLIIIITHSKTCVRQPPLKLTLVVDVER